MVPSAFAGASTVRPASININRACTKGSVANLQVQREDNGQLSVDFGVDMSLHSAGVPWKFSVTDNGTTIASGTALTISDGSFSRTRALYPKAGANHFRFRAVNQRTGEVSSIVAIY
jgi:hypothetical protein